MITAAQIETPMGPITGAATDRGVCLLSLRPPQDARSELDALVDRLGGSVEIGDHRVLDRLRAELDSYFAGRLTRFTVPLDTPGTDWEQRVWAALLEIPFGRTTSYGALARDLGNPGGSRAVGLANGRNRVAILIPCHRVVASDGSLHGYAGGLDRKRWLLDHESTCSGGTPALGGLFGSCQHTPV